MTTKHWELLLIAASVALVGCVDETFATDAENVDLPEARHLAGEMTTKRKSRSAERNAGALPEAANALDRETLETALRQRSLAKARKARHRSRQRDEPGRSHASLPGAFDAQDRDASTDPDAFTLVVLPDTQFYSEEFPDTFLAQTRFIVENRRRLRVQAVVQLGDLVDNGAPDSDEWSNADRALSLLEEPTPTLPFGIPYGVVVGNHDQQPHNDPSGTAVFNQWFGAERFEGRSYYGGQFGEDNDNSWFRFGVGEHSFILLLLEYDEDAPRSVLEWARGIMRANPESQVIVASHFLLRDDGHFSGQGKRVWKALGHEPNLILMLCGHVHDHGEGRRTDLKPDGTEVHTLLSNYQGRENGGDGWLRLMRFSPTRRQISVSTYSPKLKRWEVDDDSDFDLTY